MMISLSYIKVQGRTPITLQTITTEVNKRALKSDCCPDFQVTGLASLPRQKKYNSVMHTIVNLNNTGIFLRNVPPVASEGLPGMT
jgi:hypothetical protein